MRSVRGVLTFGIGSLITTLLALGFLVSCYLLAVHAVRDPKTDFAVVAELLLVAVLSLEGIVAVHHLRQAKLDSLHVLLQVLEDFRSAEMMLAVVTLWRFRNDHGDGFVQVYLDTWRKDDERIARLPGEQQVEAMRATLHYRRRIVKEFYNSLASLYELKVIPGKVIYTYWSAAELRIIPEVLIPLEMAVARELRTETELGDWLRRLQRLHDDRPVGAPASGS
jgi:hypothetical protein